MDYANRIISVVFVISAVTSILDYESNLDITLKLDIS